MIFLFALVICRFRWLLTVITKFLSIVVSFYQIINFFYKKNFTHFPPNTLHFTHRLRFIPFYLM
ncbi:hypothetical protein, unlikely [Trypanosoma brucei brucei TREU927]|uniref:Uncharacterized protein n=1 Tax=Trypanosoma brucei brucei (strain 927/4 GUTat10.1) TaxID=185431 RepID=Q38D85_TRYB2|nr:hypothetical protein, unlikely [Trypanosoma brucei brucei TREU927]EAN77235.1 hypothetical protein, unlikely [Trypanosoma brucei brucei TREU927]